MHVCIYIIIQQINPYVFSSNSVVNLMHNNLYHLYTNLGTRDELICLCLESW